MPGRPATGRGLRPRQHGGTRGTIAVMAYRYASTTTPGEPRRDAA
jgi:hypothetical protein